MFNQQTREHTVSRSRHAIVRGPTPFQSRGQRLCLILSRWLGSLGSQAGPIGGPQYDRHPNGMPMGLLRVLRRPEADAPGLVPATTAGRTEHLLGMLQGRAGARPGAPGSPGASGDGA